MKLIVGMHRSGTSLLARLIRGVGGNFGDPNGFYPADIWNRDGYFEQEEIITANKRLINSHYGKLAYIFLPSKKTIDKRARLNKQVIIRLSEKYKDSYVKENRFCLTLGNWRECGCQFEKIVLCVREPMAVARSIKKRNKVPIFWGLKLWQRHMSSLLEGIGTLPVWVFSYDALLNKDTREKEFYSLLDYLEIERGDDALEQISERVIRNNAESDKCSHRYPEGVERLWSKLNMMMQAQHGGQGGV